jgi:hypothetical protein
MKKARRGREGKAQADCKASFHDRKYRMRWAAVIAERQAAAKRAAEEWNHKISPK